MASNFHYVTCFWHCPTGSCPLILPSYPFFFILLILILRNINTFYNYQEGVVYRSEESRRIQCTKCGNSHIWICTNRTKANARWCQVRRICISRYYGVQLLVHCFRTLYELLCNRLHKGNLASGLLPIPPCQRWRWMGRKDF